MNVIEWVIRIISDYHAFIVTSIETHPRAAGLGIGLGLGYLIKRMPNVQQDNVGRVEEAQRHRRFT